MTITTAIRSFARLAAVVLIVLPSLLPTALAIAGGWVVSDSDCYDCPPFLT